MKRPKLTDEQEKVRHRIIEMVCLEWDEDDSSKILHAMDVAIFGPEPEE